MIFIIFVTVFLSVCFAGNFYIFRRLFQLFGIKARFIFWTVVPLLSLSYLMAILAGPSLDPGVAEVVLNVSAMWFGIALLSVTCLLINDILSFFVKTDGPTTGQVIIAIVTGLTVYSVFNAGNLKVNEVELLAPVDMNIVQLSDLHLSAGDTELIKDVVEKTNVLAPDVVLITGDLFEIRSGLDGEDLKGLNDLVAPIFFVTGNHEKYGGMENIRRLLRETKIRLLSNESVDFEGVQIIGFDDSDSPLYVKEQLSRIYVDESRYSILMNHQPSGFEDAADAGVDLMLSGHTHNGQIFPFTFVVRMRFKHIRGLYEHGDSRLYVSTGTGTWGPPMRLGRSSEIVLIKLRKTEDSD